ncbi:MAG: hypothetical protein ABII93_09025 [Chrysiogenia bacterium]
MKRSKAFSAAALGLGVLFLIHFGAELFFSFGKDKIPELGLKNLQASMKLSPLSSRYPEEAGFALLEKGIRDKDPQYLKNSIKYFQTSVKNNLLNYQSHYYLAKAFLQLSSSAGGYFDMAVVELKRAAFIRGSNKLIALDCSRVFFSIWPLLEEDDRIFATTLLANAMPALSWSEFSPLVEMWAAYVQDAALLMELLQRKPDFFRPAADLLVTAAIPMDQRRELLALHEIHTLDANERLYNETVLNGEMDAEKAQHILNHLNIRGYYRLQPDSGFIPEKLARLQRGLLLQVISGMLSDAGTRDEPKSVSRVREYIQKYIAEHSGLNDLDDLQKLLEEKNYFKDNDFPSLYFKTLITFKKGSYGDIIAEIEALRKTISFVKKEQLADYTNILLLLIDSYYSTKLMTAAESVAKELYESQPENSDVLFRVLRIRNILGVEGAPDPILDAKLETVEKSRFLTVSKTNSSHDVFLFNAAEIEITFDPALLTQCKPKQLVQIFVDGKIAFENYVDGLPEKIVIGPPFAGIESKVKVQVSII